ncbi:hypothetical protein BDV95DRAFT_558690 [Massariosphaeria phaeospora]|uniref:Uncharacterized protein n=1 Tax=Massariosphaeria phaeospora TaxID=100035 RepID=A0A7C8II74_9PLEO|nr:hypothetical protein BDV95DRAFT_558690 [Massariosphaeria phaeospora]
MGLRGGCVEDSFSSASCVFLIFVFFCSRDSVKVEPLSCRVFLLLPAFASLTGGFSDGVS